MIAPRWGEEKKKEKKTIDGVISPWWEEEGVKSLDHEQWNHQKRKKRKEKKKLPWGLFYIYFYYIFNMTK